MEVQINIDKLKDAVDQVNYNPLADDLTLAVLNSIPFEEYNECDTTALQKQKLSTLKMLSIPPKYTTVRVNTLKINLKVAEETVGDYIKKNYNDKTSRIPMLYTHPILSDLLVIKSSQKLDVIPASKEVIVRKVCGAAVMRGAHVYGQGVLSVNPNIVVGEKVAVYADIHEKCLRGSKFFQGIKIFLGNGIAKQSRKDLFHKNTSAGLAFEMVEQIHKSPSLGDLHPDFLFLQNLPSVVCSHVLCPPPHSVVLDMCAAPGGKTTHIATLMKNTGLVIAIDRSQARINQIETRARSLDLSNIKTFCYDSSKIILISRNQTIDSQLKTKKMSLEECTNKNVHQISPPFLPLSFDYILLDAPCSGLGQRPQLATKMSLKCLKSFPVMQRKLFENAVQLLRVGGKLVYSTCTIVAEENEMMVKWALQKYKEIKLIDSQPKLGLQGLLGCGLSKEDCAKLQRFGPMFQGQQNTQNSCSGENLDTIGFFIAPFTKV
ncbi:unnamed protein product, partial [Meganyctiphanes norvegica]